ncbi:MAG: PKD domain-containing protein [Actinomycetia bacterium]|nr:PKD domain-containing protein [Actinomycetes bacterium]
MSRHGLRIPLRRRVRRQFRPRSTVLAVAVGFLTMAALVTMTTQPAAAEIEVEAPLSSAVGLPVTVTAFVTEGGRPVEGETVTLSRMASIGGARGWAELDAGLTDANGAIILEFIEHADSNSPAQFRVEHEGTDGPETAEFQLVVHTGPQQYVTTAGVDTGPVNVYWLFVILAVLWIALAFAVFQLVRVARAAGDVSRGFSAAPYIMFGFVVFTAIGMFVVTATRPATHAVLSPNEQFERNPAAVLGVTYDYLGHRSEEVLGGSQDGATLYVQAGCAGCHGIPTVSPGVVGGEVASLAALPSADAFNDLVRHGPTGMPAYGPSVLSDVEIQAIREWAMAASGRTGTDQDPSIVVMTGGPYAGEVQEGITFDGRRSEALRGAIVAYRWDFGDGGPVVDFGEGGAIMQHAFLTDGTYDVTLTIVDEAGREASASTTVIVGTGRPPPDLAAGTSPDAVDGGATGAGSEIFGASCAGCHSPGGIGGDLAATELTPSELRSVVADGTGAMPGFANQLTDEELDLVVEYMATLGGG